MPCFDAEEARERGEAVEKLAKVEAMLCAVLTTVDKSDPYAISHLYTFIDESVHGVTGQEVLAWWENHKAKDRLHSKKP